MAYLYDVSDETYDERIKANRRSDMEAIGLLQGPTLEWDANETLGFTNPDNVEIDQRWDA